MYFTTTTIAAFAAILSGVDASPIQSAPAVSNLVARADYAGCSADQKTTIQTHLKEVGTLAKSAYQLLGQDKDKWSKNNGWKHYFKDEDHDKVRKAYEVLMTVGTDKQGIKYEVRCGTNGKECGANTGFAYADATEESYAGPGYTKGTRLITICPPFFTDENSKRNLPGNDADTKKYCENKESKKILKFETGGHTLLHEMSHLDSFGVAAGYPEETHKKDDKREGDFEFKFHGTVDWKPQSNAGNARTLKNSKAKNRPERWQNAESLAAAASEIYAMGKCDIKDIDA
jgi:hypothetical protein